MVRPRHHIEAVRRDAQRAAERSAARSGEPPSRLITDAISWALGERDQAPFTSKFSLNGPTRGDVDSEIKACAEFLENTPWSEEAEDAISRANHVLEVLKWLTGVDDVPPTYCRETQPGDLVGGCGQIVRPHIEIRRMRLLAQQKLAAGQTSYALGADWHHGVIATLDWVLSERPDSPILGTARDEPPEGPQIAIEQAEAEEHITPPLRHTDIPFHYADAVAVTCRWLLGATTQPPVTDDA